MKLSIIQKHSFKTALLSSLIILVIGVLIYLSLGLSIWSVALFFTLIFIALFIAYVQQTKRFIYEQLKRVYNSSLLENEPFLKREIIDLNFEFFIERINKYIENKRLEIEKLHNRDDFRKDFMGDVSHELKTPLFSAQGYLYTIMDPSFEDEELKRKYLKRTSKSIERLSYIVKDLDMIGKLESGMKLRQDSFNIVKAVGEVFDILEIKANKKNISLDFDEVYDYPIMVKADKEKIEQVLINLISNSINYGKVSGQTTVSIKTHSKRRVIINVIDDGAGIEPEHIPRLFERFYRIDKSRSRDHGGSGLGLAIVKHIVEAHQQELLVKSEPSKGSVFSFTLNKAD